MKHYLVKLLNSTIFFVFIFLFSFNVYALRCGNRLVDEGDSIELVRKVCGEPDRKKEWAITLCSFNNKTNSNSPSCVINTVPMAEWVYAKSIGSAYNVLLFRDNKLVSISFER